MTFKVLLFLLLIAKLVATSVGSSICSEGILAKDTRECQANPYIFSVSTGGSRSMTQADGMFACIRNSCEIIVVVGNSGSSAFFSVAMFYSPFGITFGGWKLVSSQNIRLEPSMFSTQGTATVVFPVEPLLRKDQSRVCIRIQLLPISGGNCNETVSLCIPDHVLLASHISLRGAKVRKQVHR